MGSQRRRPRTTQVQQLGQEKGLLSRFEAWITAGASSSQTADVTHRERVRNVGIGTVVATAGFLVETIEGVRIQVPVVVISGLIVVALFLGALFFLRKTQKFALVGHVVLTGVLFATCANLLFTGGFTFLLMIILVLHVVLSMLAAE